MQGHGRLICSFKLVIFVNVLRDLRVSTTVKPSCKHGNSMEEIVDSKGDDMVDK